MKAKLRMWGSYFRVKTCGCFFLHVQVASFHAHRSIAHKERALHTPAQLKLMHKYFAEYFWTTLHMHVHMYKYNLHIHACTLTVTAEEMIAKRIYPQHAELYVHVYIYTYICICIRMYIHTCTNAVTAEDMTAKGSWVVRIHIHIHIHMHMHTYIHAQMQSLPRIWQPKESIRSTPSLFWWLFTCEHIETRT